MSEAIEIVEVGARDGLQNEKAVLDVADKVAFVRRLEACGARRIEAVSFVNPRRYGTGLGLALVAKVIDDDGGIIEFDSQPRKTVFRVFLPVVPRDNIVDGRNDTGS